jgi:hypothetical protein
MLKRAQWFIEPEMNPMQQDNRNHTIRVLQVHAPQVELSFWGIPRKATGVHADELHSLLSVWFR